MEDLQRDIAVIKETFQRRVDCKNAVIQSLAKDIQEAEEQYRMALRRHIHQLDEVVSFQQKRVGTLEGEYRAELEALRAECDEERCVREPSVMSKISKLGRNNTLSLSLAYPPTYPPSDKVSNDLAARGRDEGTE